MQSRIIAEIILAGARVVGRAIGNAIKEEYIASQQAAKARNKGGGQGNGGKNDGSWNSADKSSGMTLSEAKMILNVKDLGDIEALQKNYDHLFSVNDKSKGGSLYLQSKVFRAKERIDLEKKEGEKTTPKEAPQN